MSYQFPRDGYEGQANDWGAMGQESGSGVPRQQTDTAAGTTIIENGEEVTELKTTLGTGKRHEERQPPFSFITDPTINSILLNINPQLFVSKLFYLFFYSAFGSLFPLLAVYFKQLGMNPIQAGTLIGIRPFVEFIAAPFWSSLADRFHKCKAILLFSLCCWIIFTFSLAFIRPPASACVIFNETNHILFTPYSNQPQEIFDDTSTLWPNTEEATQTTLINASTLSPESVPILEDAAKFVNLESQHRIFKRDEEEEGIVRKWGIKHRPPPTHVVGKSPLTVEYTLNYNQDKHSTYVSPPFSTIVYKLDDVKEVFFLLFLLVVLGEFFSAPAITLADSATLSYLGEDTDKYGQQRMYGSFGWGIIMFLVGIALDNSTKFKDHPCGPHSGERNYVTCFSIFALLMTLTLLIATKFQFEESDQEYSNEIQMNQYDYEASGPKPWQNTAPAINVPKDGTAAPNSGTTNKKTEFIDRWKSAVYAQRTRKVPNWVGVLRSMNNQRRLAFLFVAWFMGFGVGLVFTFLFWHLQDLGGTPTLYGLASVINHLSEIAAYFYSINLIKRIGHTKVLCAGLLFNAARFLYVAWLDNPWWVLPFELIQGVTHAAVWAAACSYIMGCTEPELRSSAQGVMQGIYQGLGRGSGSILGGMIIHRFGSRVAFGLYGLLSAAFFGLFVHVNYYHKEEGGYKFEEENVEQVVINDSSALAPHGVPTNPIARSVSRQNVESNANAAETQPIGRQNNLSAQYASTTGATTTATANDQYGSFDPNEAWN
ncbi:Major facilitator super domain-containing protein 6 [Tyrophagus putrescentiae]|nr:Major facilitator super domain-containing protein 6 [Tyrophagus putrescentiae]